MWPLLLVLASAAHATHLHGHEVRFLGLDASTARRRSLAADSRLWLLKTQVPPPRELVHGWLGDETYVVKSTTLAEFTGFYAPLEAKHKFPPGLNTSSKHSFGVLARVTDSVKSIRHLPFALKVHALSKNYVAIISKTSLPINNADVLQTIAASPNVVWISGLPEIKRRHLFVSDTGLDTSHCFFASNSVPPNGTIYLNGSYANFSSPPPGERVQGIARVEYLSGQFTDFKGADGAHGTATAGLAAGQLCVDAGNVSRQGSSNVSLLFLDIAPDRGETGSEVLDIPYDFTTIFEFADANKASVHSASWGSTCADGSYDGLAYQFDEAARNFDLLQVVAAGNAGDGGSSCGGYLVASPATGKNVLSVGATETPLHVASFTSRGPLPNGARVPILVGPGVNVVVAHAFYTAEQNHTDFSLGTGTSFPTPWIAGLAAQLDVLFGRRILASSKIAVLVATAVPSQGVFSGGVIKPSRVDLSFGTPSLASLPFLEENATSGERVATCFTGNGSITVVLAWTDLPSYPGTSRTLVNDLDLVVAVLFPNGTEIALVSDTSVDTVERVSFTGANLSFRAIVVPTSTIHDAPQPFSVAVLGSVSQVPCGGTCYQDDVASCTIAFGYGTALCAENGTGTCAANACVDPHLFAPDGSCSLSVSAGLPTCQLTHGTGRLVSSTCQLQTCDPNYHFLSQSACVCDPIGLCTHDDGSTHRVGCDVPCSTTTPPPTSQSEFIIHVRAVPSGTTIALSAFFSFIFVICCMGILCEAANYRGKIKRKTG